MNTKTEIRQLLNGIVKSFHKSSSLEEKLDLANQYLKILYPNVYLFEDPVPDTDMEEEKWRNCIGWEGIYQVSSWGRIKSMESFFIKTTKGRTMAVYRPELIRTERFSPRNYRRTSFWRNGHATHYAVHRLVAIHFLPNPNNYKEVLHNDDNPKNAHYTNLEWGTQSKNILDAVARNRGYIGSKNGNSKLKEEDIPKIRELLKTHTCREVGKLFGVTKTPIQWIKANKSWKHVK